MPDWGKMLVGVRLEKTISDEFFDVWTRLLSGGLRDGDRWFISRGKTAHRAANAAARELLKSDCDTLFFLDSDADIDPDFLHRFRDFEPGWEYDALQAFYTRRGWPPEAIWFQRDSQGVLKKCYVLDEVTEPVALVGLHACLIRRSVFEKLLGDNQPQEHDWFFYPRHTQITEDAAFSDEAIHAGFKIGATTAVKAGHISQVTVGWETYQDYLHASGQIERIERYGELMPLLMQFTGCAEDEIANRAAAGAANVTQAWGQAEKTADEARAFYGLDDNGYLYDLFHWNSSLFFIQLTRPLKTYMAENALVIGGGLGTEAALLSEHNIVTVFELPGVLRRFLQLRFNGNNKVRVLGADRLENLSEAHTGAYSLVTAIDVIEHVHPDELDGFLKTIDRLLAPGGVLYAHVNFGQQDIYPMHYNHAQAYSAFLDRRGFIRETAMTWRKPGERKDEP